MLQTVYRLGLRLLSWLVVLAGTIGILAYVFGESTDVLRTIVPGAAVFFLGASGLRRTRG